jgi:hypothetical protein
MWVILGLGILGMVAAIVAFWQMQRARSFRPVPGRITERSVRGAPWYPLTGGWGPYTLRVKYAYLVDGNEFSSERFALVPRRYWRKGADAELARLPEAVTVFVNPQNPKDAVVDRQGAQAVIWTFCVGAFAVLYAAVAIALQ